MSDARADEMVGRGVPAEPRNRSRSRAWVRGALFALLLLLSAWWLLYVPRPPGGLARVIPEEATVLGTHMDLAGRWQQAAASPLAGSLFAAVGVPRERIASAMKDPRVDLAVSQLAGKEITWAYLPPTPFRREPAWVFVSWLGARGHFLRWFYQLTSPDYLVPQPWRAGGSYWLVKSPALPARLSASLALLEGMMVAVVSENPFAIQDVLETYEGHRPAMSDVLQDELTFCGEATAPDSGWVLPPSAGGGGKEPWPRFPLRYLLSRLDDEGLAGQVCLPEGLVAEADLQKDVDQAWLTALLGDEPMAVVAAEPYAFNALVSETVTPSVGSALGAIILEEGVGSVAVALLGGDRSGRYMGVKVPTLLTAVRVADPPRAMKAVHRLIDTVNARHPWGLVPRAVPAGDQLAYGLERTGDNAPLKLSFEERPAFALVGDWLVAGSNLAGLRSLLEQPPGKGVDSPAWLAGLASEGTVAGYGWLDFKTSAKTIRGAIKLYLLKLRTVDDSASREWSQYLTLTLGWMEALEPLETLQLWIKGDDAQTAIHFVLGTTS